MLAHLSRIVPHRIAVCAQKAVDVHGALGYDLTLFAPDDASRVRLREQWLISDELLLLGMVGRFDPQKDQANLIDALALLRQQGVAFVCVFVGPGMDVDNASLMQHIMNAGLVDQVHLLGSREDIPAVMNALDLHVLSSSYGEAFPNVLAEAMACGTPCVTTDVGDAAVIVGETGWVVPPCNSDALSIGIESALLERRDQPKVWAARQAAVRNRIMASFSLEKMISAYSGVWQE